MNKTNFVFKKKKKSGFTLAEVLLVITIIGIIASYTIPPLVQNIQDMQLRTAWKSNYSDFSRAAQALASDNDNDLSKVFGSVLDHDNFRDPFLPYLNYIQKCDAGSATTGNTGCWHAANTWYYLSGAMWGASCSTFSRLVLSNGSLVFFEHKNTTCTGTNTPNDDNCGLMRIDINGFKKPNMIGKDIFSINLLKNGSILPQGVQGDFWYNKPQYGCDLTADPAAQGYNCSVEVLYE